MTLSFDDEVSVLVWVRIHARLCRNTYDIRQYFRISIKSRFFFSSLSLLIFALRLSDQRVVTSVTLLEKWRASSGCLSKWTKNHQEGNDIFILTSSTVCRLKPLTRWIYIYNNFGVTKYTNSSYEFYFYNRARRFSSCSWPTSALVLKVFFSTIAYIGLLVDMDRISWYIGWSKWLWDDKQLYWFEPGQFKGKDYKLLKSNLKSYVGT